MKGLGKDNNGNLRSNIQILYNILSVYVGYRTIELFLVSKK